MENKATAMICSSLGMLLATGFVGCTSGGQTGVSWNPPGGWEAGESAVVDLFREGRYDSALSEARKSCERGEPVDRLLWQMEMVSALLLKGDKEAAKMFLGDKPGILDRKGWTIERNAKVK